MQLPQRLQMDGEDVKLNADVVGSLWYEKMGTPNHVSASCCGFALRIGEVSLLAFNCFKALQIFSRDHGRQRRDDPSIGIQGHQDLL